jgi:hypothetical protein
MKGSRAGRQLSDFFAYLLIPALSVLLPASGSRWLIRKTSSWRWLMAAVSDEAWQGAKEFVEAQDEVTFKRRWKQVELLDVRDLYMILCGRDGAVMAEVQMDVPLEVAKDRVMIGMHWGPSISILHILSKGGLLPAFPYRPPERVVFRLRPFYQVFSMLAGRYIVKTLGDRAVPIGGAGSVLRGLADQPGSIVVLTDSPPMQGRPVLHSDVLDKSASFNAGFPNILADTEKEYVFYAISLKSDKTATKKLELDGPYSSAQAQDFLQGYSDFMSQHLSRDPAQWRFWHVAQQFWYER